MKRLKTHWDTFFHLQNDYYAKPVHVFQIIKISLNPVFFILSGWKLHFNNMVKNLSAKYEPDWVKEIYAPEKWCRTNGQTDRLIALGHHRPIAIGRHKPIAIGRHRPIAKGRHKQIAIGRHRPIAIGRHSVGS